MRWVRDIALLVLLIAIGVGAWWFMTDSREHAASIDKALADVQRLEREVRYRAAIKSVALNYRGWPMTIDPAWFDTDPPRTPLAGDDRPWLEIAPESEYGYLHPPIRLTLDDQMPAFWYNPYQGVVRARVPVDVSDEQALAMYNKVNRVSIPSIHWVETPQELPKPKTDKPEVATAAAVDAEPPKIAPASNKPASERQRQIVVVHRTSPKGK